MRNSLAFGTEMSVSKQQLREHLVTRKVSGKAAFRRCTKRAPHFAPGLRGDTECKSVPIAHNDRLDYLGVNKFYGQLSCSAVCSCCHYFGGEYGYTLLCKRVAQRLRKIGHLRVVKHPLLKDPLLNLLDTVLLLPQRRNPCRSLFMRQRNEVQNQISTPPVKFLHAVMSLYRIRQSGLDEARRRSRGLLHWTALV